MPHTPVAAASDTRSRECLQLIPMSYPGSFELLSNTRPVGRVHVHPRIVCGHRYPEVEVFISEHARGRGYGRVGLELIAGYLLSDRYPTIVGHIHKGKRDAVHSALSAGFHIMHDYGGSVLVARSQ